MPKNSDTSLLFGENLVAKSVQITENLPSAAAKLLFGEPEDNKIATLLSSPLPKQQKLSTTVEIETPVKQ